MLVSEATNNYSHFGSRSNCRYFS